MLRKYPELSQIYASEGSMSYPDVESVVLVEQLQDIITQVSSRYILSSRSASCALSRKVVRTTGDLGGLVPKVDPR